MRAFLIRRLIGSCFVLVGISVLTFLIAHVLPADPAKLAVGGHAGADQVAAMRQRMGLDRPLYVQYALYVNSLAHGDLGYSFTSKRPVLDDLRDYFPASMELGVSALAIAVVFGIPLGVLAAYRSGTWLDQLIAGGSVFGAAMPLFLLGLVFQLVFYSNLGWFPATGRIDTQLGAPAKITGMFVLDSLLRGDVPRLGNSLRHLALPALTLSLPALAILIRMVRATMLETLGRDYVRTARSKGLRERAVVFRHALRNAILPTLTSLGLLVGALLSGAFLVEVVYTFPGLGLYVLNSIVRAEFTAIISTTVLIATIYMLANLVVDIAYVFVDPRIRYH